MLMVLGIIIFIDDYFNSLTVGPISRPVTDRHRVSRAKLAYIVDSTAAPISVIAPISSWGAYIIGLIGSVLVAVNVTDRKSTRLNSSHVAISYAVFCLKKKNTN